MKRNENAYYTSISSVLELMDEGKMPLTWKRDPMLDSWEAHAPEGRYFCSRTYCDVAVLYLNGKELRRSGSDGGHDANKAFAEKHSEDEARELMDEGKR